MSHTDMPAITESDLKRAYAVLCYRGTTFDLAMADPLRAQIIRTCATRLVAIDFESHTLRTVVPERRIRLGVDGHPIGWVTRMAEGPRTAIQQPPLF